MKIEKSKPRRGVVELPLHTKQLVGKLQSCSDHELTSTLETITVWKYGKCELYHWVDVLDRFDKILSEACRDGASPANSDPTQCVFMCPRLQDDQFKRKVVAVLYFTALLVEHSYTRNIYNSTEHLCTLLASSDMDVVLAVLNLLYVFSKRSNFISRLPQKHRFHLNSCLEFLGETWGGKQNGFGLAQCCSETHTLPAASMTVFFEYQPEVQTTASKSDLDVGQSTVILENVDQSPESIEAMMSGITREHRIPQMQQMQLLTRIRLARNFTNHQQRLKCVLARLHAISILVYSIAPMDVVDPLIYDGLVEELVEVLEIRDSSLMEIRAAVLRTLTAIIHLERDPRLGAIIEATGASTYHGFLPSLVRDCVASFTLAKGGVATADTGAGEFPLSFATALFSFLYHLATYEASGDALVGSGVMESLIQVLEWKAFEPSNITLVTRAVRVIDLITNLDMSAFHSLGGWDKMLERLEMEVAQCRGAVPFLLPSTVLPSSSSSSGGGSVERSNVPLVTERETGNNSNSADVGSAETPAVTVETETPVVAMDTTEATGGASVAAGNRDSTPQLLTRAAGKAFSSGVLSTCMPERAALIKSILNFLKKAIPEPTFSENMRTFVDSSLPHSLKHIVSNAEYYGPSIYLPATEVATVFIFHEPSQLTPLQDNGLPGVMLNSIINKQVSCPVARSSQYHYFASICGTSN
jgi:E3 ubiquitin-protein ligase HUWE1